ncbi:MAG: FIST C-terminal domain-containing protein [Chlorobi bacterium]|nr:FIST C-terminal domain-containing protein [Chlorobiota bacterium]
MKIEQQQWMPNSGWLGASAVLQGQAQLVLSFGQIEAVEDPNRYGELRQRYPNAHIIICSTSGEIFGEAVYDDSITATAIAFNDSTLIAASLNIADFPDSNRAGRELAGMIPAEGLAHLFLITDGQLVNGSEVVAGVRAVIPDTVAVTGGLASDGARFTRTLVGLDSPPTEGTMVAVGFYGANLRVGYGTMGGWDSFGPDRVITRSERNVLYELDGQSALALYKKYLGELAADLPGSALLFPLSLRTPDQPTPVVRTILSINENDDSMVFAGDMPQGAYARLMKANFDRLIDGASHAAAESYQTIGTSQAELAILISCVGRKLVLGPRTEEEVEAVREVVGPATILTGFYSNGEISPLGSSVRCELHNQTMTITTISELPVTA